MSHAGGGSPNYAGGGSLAEVVRSGFVESWHRGSVAVLAADGAVLDWAGDPYGAIFPRSANKPMQAVGMLRAGLTVADSAELALVAASHWGEPRHLTVVLAMLARAGLTGSALRCPAALPLGPAAAEAHLRAGGEPGPVLRDCSGKHTGMLLTCQSAGWPLEDYVEPGHPLQQRLRVAVEELSGHPVAVTGVDGCGAPVFALPLVGLARAFLRLVSAAPGTPERAVADAMRAHPELVSGTGAMDARVMRAIPGALSKGGAEGVLGVAVPGVGAVAVKVDDGTFRAHLPVLRDALERLGVAVPPDLAEPVVVLGGGRVVGEIRSRTEWATSPWATSR